MKKLIVLLAMLLATPVMAGPLLSIEAVPLDTVVSTAADTTDFTAYQSRYANYFCGPLVVWAYVTELSDSTEITFYYEYAVDTTNMGGYTLFDSTVMTSSISGASGTELIIDTLLADGINALMYRVRAVGGANNDKESGSTILVTGVATPCGSSD